MIRFKVGLFLSHIGAVTCILIALSVPIRATDTTVEISSSVFSPLMIAVFKNDTESISTLLKNGADVNLTDRFSGRTALHFAAQDGNIAAVKMLIASGADISSRDAFSRATPLHLAAASGRSEVVNEMISRGADPAAADAFGRTALDLSKSAGLASSGRAVEILAEDQPSRPSEADERRNSELLSVIRSGLIEEARKKIAEGADMEWRTAEGDLNALSTAVMTGHDAMTTALLDLGASIDAADNAGFTALMLAARHGRDSVVNLLVSRGAAIDLRNEAGSTALFLSALKGHSSVVRALINAGADPNITSEEKIYTGWTPLMAAAAWGHDGAAKELLIGRADHSIRNRNGWTAYKIATVNGRAIIAAMLTNVGAKE